MNAELIQHIATDFTTWGVPHWAFLVALVTTAVALPIVNKAAISLELYDRPDSGLKPHEKPVPYLGGVAIYLGWLGALVYVAYMVPGARTHLIWIASGGTILMLVGLIDDIRHIRPSIRLLLQAGVAAMLMGGGIGRGMVLGLLEPVRDSLPGWLFADPVIMGASGALCFIVLAGATNSTNLIDGLDGLCAGTLAVASIGFLFVNAHLALAGEAENVMPVIRVALAVAVVGACLSFLRCNFNPAKLFMGDSGSLLLGFNVAVMMILFAENPSWRWLLASVVVFGFPIFDTALAIARRRLNGKPLFVGDRSHFYDQLRDRGLGVRQTVLFCYLLSAVFAALGALIVRLPLIHIVCVVVACPIFMGLVCWRLGLLRVDDAASRSEQGA